MNHAISYIGGKSIKDTLRHNAAVQNLYLLKKYHGVSPDKVQIIGTARDPVAWWLSLYRHNVHSDVWGGWLPSFTALLFPPTQPPTVEEAGQWLAEERPGVLDMIFDAYFPRGSYLCRTTHLFPDFQEMTERFDMVVNEQNWKKIQNMGVVETFPRDCKKVPLELSPELTDTLRADNPRMTFFAQEGGLV